MPNKKLPFNMENPNGKKTCSYARKCRHLLEGSLSEANSPVADDISGWPLALNLNANIGLFLLAAAMLARHRAGPFSCGLFRHKKNGLEMATRTGVVAPTGLHVHFPQLNIF